MRPARLVLGLLLATDLVFIAVHVIHSSSPYLASPLNALDRDRGHAEYFQYTKLYWIVLLVGLLWLRHHASVFAGWLLLFIYLLADDLLGLHEAGGLWLADAYALQGAFGLRARDVGELLITAAAGAVALLLLGIGYMRADRASRFVSRRLFVALAALACVGVGIDMLHQMLAEGAFEPLLVVAEDGGEMLIVSAMLWLVFRAVLTPPAAAASTLSPPVTRPLREALMLGSPAATGVARLWTEPRT